MPFIATALVAETGNIYAGLMYPIGIALATAAIGGILIKEKRHGHGHAHNFAD